MSLQSRSGLTLVAEVAKSKLARIRGELRAADSSTVEKVTGDAHRFYPVLRQFGSARRSVSPQAYRLVQEAESGSKQDPQVALCHEVGRLQVLACLKQEPTRRTIRTVARKLVDPAPLSETVPICADGAQSAALPLLRSLARDLGADDLLAIMDQPDRRQAYHQLACIR